MYPKAAEDRIIPICKRLILSLALIAPAAAGASVDPRSALHTYAQARLADSDGALALAVTHYGEALARDPDRVEIAQRAYVQALESGDKALALQSAALLDQAGLLPRDGTLLRIGEALEQRNWIAANTLVDRMEQEGNFAFIGPILRSWIAAGEGQKITLAIDPQDRFAALAQRYVDEHQALLALNEGDIEGTIAPLRRAITIRPADALLRLSFATQLAARKAKAEALLLLPPNDAHFARARTDIARRRVKASPLTPAQGYARLLARLATDIGSDRDGVGLALRLARIATFADPGSFEHRIVAARLLTVAGFAAAALAETAKVPPGWYSAIAQAERVDALAADGQMDAALALARTLAAEPDAEPERHVRLGRLLAERQDFDGAAAAFRAAQTRFGDADPPWSLLLFEGSALEQGKRWEEARTVLERAAALAPNEPVILNYLGYAQIERRQNVEAALDLLKKASALKPQDPSITDSLGWAHYVTGNVKAAVPVLERAAAGAPSDVTINEHLGDALWTAGRRYEARYAWAAASVYAEGDVAARIAAKAKEGLKPEYAAP